MSSAQLLDRSAPWARTSSRRPGPRPVRSQPARSRPTWSRLVVVLPALVLLVLGAVELAHPRSLWYDEDYTLLAVRTPLPQLLSAVWNAHGLVSWLTVPPSYNAPYYVLMHAWCALFGTSSLALRLPSLLCSAAAVAVVAATARRLGGDVAGLVAGLLCATGPLLVQQAVEARSYGAAELATATTALLLVRRRQGHGRRLPLGIAAASAGLLHWFTLPVLLGLGVWALLSGRRRGLPDAVVLALASLPGVALVVLSLRGNDTGAPITVPVGWTLPLHAVADWSVGGWVLSVAMVVVFAMAVVRSRARGLLCAWVLVPLAVVTVGDVVRPMYFSRYLLFALLGLAAGAGVGVAQLPGRRLRAAAATALVALSVGIALPRLQTTSREHQDGVVALLEAQQVAGQPVAAADGRAALELEEEVALQGSRLSADLLLRPEHVPVDGTATTTWVVRSSVDGTTTPDSPDDAYLAAGGWHLASTVVVAGEYGNLLVQQWVR